MITAVFQAFDFDDVCQGDANRTCRPKSVELNVRLVNFDLQVQHEQQQDRNHDDAHAQPEKQIAILVIHFLPPVNSETEKRQHQPAQERKRVVPEVLLLFVERTYGLMMGDHCNRRMFRVESVMRTSSEIRSPKIHTIRPSDNKTCTFSFWRREYLRSVR